MARGYTEEERPALEPNWESVAKEVISEQMDPFAERERIRQQARDPGYLMKETGKAALVGAGLGAAAGALPGGMGVVPGAVTTGGIAAVSRGAGLATEAFTGDPWEAMAIEFITDPMLTGGFHALGKLGLHVDPYVRAAQKLRRSGFAGQLGSEGAYGVVEAVEQGGRAMKQEVDAAYDAWRAKSRFGSLTKEEVIRSFDPIRTVEFPDKVPDSPVKWVENYGANEPIDADRLNSWRGEFTDLARSADQAGRSKEAGKWRRFAREGIDNLEDLLVAKQNPDMEDEARESLRMLRYARGKRAEQGRLMPETGPDAAVYQKIISPRTQLEAPRVAIHEIFQSRRPLTAYHNMRRLVERRGNPAALRQFDMDMRQAAIDYLFARRKGSLAAAGSPATAGAVVGKAKAGKEEAVLSEIFTPQQYDFLTKNLEEIASGTRQGRFFGVPVRDAAKELEPTVKAEERGGGSKYLMGFMVGGGFLGSFGERPVEGAVLGAGTYGASRVIDFVMSTYGPRAARGLAMRALYDPSFYAKVMRKAGQREGVTLARRLVESAMRRGVLTDYDVWTTEEPPIRVE